MLGKVREESGGGLQKKVEVNSSWRIWKNAQCSKWGSVAKIFLPRIRDPWDLLLRPPTSALSFHCSVLAAPLPQSCLRVKCDPH